MTRRSPKLRANRQQTTLRTMRFTAPVKIEAAAQPGADGKPGPAKFAGQAYSGGPLPGYVIRNPDHPAGLDAPVYIDLQGMKVDRSLKANLDHSPKQRVGHLTKVDNDHRKVEVEGLLSAATPHRDEVLQGALDGFPWDISIETTVDKLVSLAAGKTANVNGRQVVGPAYILRKSRMIGLAFAGDGGADPDNHVRIAAQRRKDSDMDFETWLADNGFDAETITDAQRTVLRASYDARHKPANPPAPPAPPAGDGDDMLGGRRLEAQRVEQIKLIAHRYFDQCPSDGDRIEQLARQARDEGWTANEFELRLLRGSRQLAQPRLTSNGGPLDGRILEAALLRSAGLPNLEKHYDETILEAADDRRFRHIGIQQLLLMAAAANGYPAQPGERILPGNLETILQYAFPPATAQLRASFSTISLPSILGNVANKEISEGFAEEPQEWREIAIVKPVNNFHEHKTHRLLDDLEYQDLGPTGEIQHGKLSEETYTRQAKTRAIMLGLSREDIINDDAGAFDTLRTRIGLGAGRKLRRIFWTKFLDNSTFFTSARGNYLAGATTNLGSDGVGLEQAVLKFFQLKTSAADGSKRVGGRAELLLVPPELMFIAERLYVSANVNTGGGSSAETVPSENIHARKYRPVPVPELSDAAYAGSSTKAYYVLRSPRIAPAMVVSALGGRVEPTVESAAADFNHLGVNFRGFADVGADQAEYLAGVKVKGEA